MVDIEMAAENEDAPETPKSLVSKSVVFSEQCSPAMIRIKSDNIDQKFYEDKDQPIREHNEEILFDHNQGLLCSEAESAHSEEVATVK